jgi:peptidoglycan/LPS O-acetylase OafA/YrhL
VYHRRATPTTFALLGVCVLDAALVQGFGIALLMICVFYTVFLLIALGKAPFLNLRLLTFLGAISYSLYLLHENMGYLLLGLLHRQGVNANVAVGITILVAVALAAATTFLIERPAMTLIRRWYKSRQARGVQPVQITSK